MKGTDWASRREQEPDARRTKGGPYGGQSALFNTTNHLNGVLSHTVSIWEIMAYSERRLGIPNDSYGRNSYSQASLSETTGWILRSDRCRLWGLVHGECAIRVVAEGSGTYNEGGYRVDAAGFRYES